MTKTKIGNYAFPSKVKHDPQEEGKGSKNSGLHSSSKESAS